MKILDLVELGLFIYVDLRLLIANAAKVGLYLLNRPGGLSLVPHLLEINQLSLAAPY